jgi:hypothetical protein
MVKKLNPSFVEYFATYLKNLLADKKNNETITAEMFQEQVTNAANVYLNQNYGIDAGGVRSAIAQSTPEAECANAIKARALHKIGPDPRISHYKTQAEIGGLSSPDTLERAQAAHPEVTNWTSKTNMLLYDETAKKMRQQSVPFNIESAVYCGNCWICDTDVMSYTGPSTEEHRTKSDSPTKEWLEGTTPCGDCEHVSAIMASYIAGMLKSAGFAKFYWASYYVACVECNRKKSNYIGVRLHATRGWEVDADGVEAILNAIFSKNIVKIHESEYNPIRNALTNKYNDMSFAEKEDFRASVRANITSGTQTWCDAANENMTKTTAKTKHLKMAFNVSKIIVAITGHLKVITGPLEKKTKKRNAESKVVKVARPGPKSTGKRARGGAPPEDQVLARQESGDEGQRPPTPKVGDSDGTQESGDEGQRPQTPIVGYNDTQESGDEGQRPQTPKVGDSDGTQESDDEELISLSRVHEADEKNDVVMAPQEKADDDTDDKDDYIMQWNNLLDNEDDDDENDETEYAVDADTEETILTYIGKIYGPRLFAQYELGPAIFNKLMVNLSTSMEEMMNVSKQGQVASSSSQSSASGETTIFEFGQKAESADDTKSKKTDQDEDRTAKKARPESRAESTSVPISPPRRGGSRLNKRHSKNSTKRISYIKHKQTRKNTQNR